MGSHQFREYISIVNTCLHGIYLCWYWIYTEQREAKKSNREEKEKFEKNILQFREEKEKGISFLKVREEKEKFF